MRRKKIGLFLLAGMLAAAPVTARAEVYRGEDDWRVAFTQEKKMESNFTTQELSEAAAGLQPGDEVRLTVALTNQYGGKTDWYMRNDIRESLEDASSTAEGGAYTYKLTYTAPDGEKTELFNSDTVGGDDVSEAGEGLNEATSALDEYFYLDNLAAGQEGEVTLKVGLEGETQGNDYQDTLARLELSFAVELDETPAPQTPQEPQQQILDERTPKAEAGTPVQNISPDAVKTGDETRVSGYVLLMAASGLVLLLLAGRNCLAARRERKGAS